MIMWVWHILRMRIKSSRHVAWPVRFEFGRGYTGWEASGVILDCCRCITGVSCTMVLHLAIQGSADI